MARTSSVIVGGGIQAGTPFALNFFTFVANTNPATITSSSIMKDVAGPPEAVVLAAAGTDPQPAATEILRLKGGIIAEGLGTGVTDTFVGGRGVTTLPTNSTQSVILIPHAATYGANAIIGSVMIGDTQTWTGAAGPAGVVMIGRNLSVGNSGVFIAPDSTIGIVGAGNNTVVGRGNTLTASQGSADTIIIGHNNTVDGGNGQGGHVVLGPSNTIHATATLGGNVILVGPGNFASDGTKDSVMVGIQNGFSVSGSGQKNILIGRNNQANGAAGPFSSNILIGWGTKFDTLPNAGVGVIAFLDSQNVGYSTIIFGNGGGGGASVVSGAPLPLLFRLTNASGANVVAGNITMQPGMSTGNAAGGQVIFQTGQVQAAGATAQPPVNRLIIGGTSTTPTLNIAAPDSNTAVPVVVINGLATNVVFNFVGFTNGAGAQVGTLTNAPVAGNPSFWMPIQVAGVARFFPCW